MTYHRIIGVSGIHPKGVGASLGAAGLAENGPIGYCAAMPFLLRHVARYAAQKLASNSRVRENAAKVVRVVGDEAKQITREEDKARAAGRALRRTIKKLQGDR